MRYGQLGVLNFVLSMLHNVNLTKHIKYRSSEFQETRAPSTTSWSPSLPEGGLGKAPSDGRCRLRGDPSRFGGRCRFKLSLNFIEEYFRSCRLSFSYENGSDG